MRYTNFSYLFFFFSVISSVNFFIHSFAESTEHSPPQKKITLPLTQVPLLGNKRNLYYKVHLKKKVVGRNERIADELTLCFVFYYNYCQESLKKKKIFLMTLLTLLVCSLKMGDLCRGEGRLAFNHSL